MAYTPRLNSDGMSGNPKWYSRNPFYQSGYGLPNCTCYAWGRWWEISDPNNQFINRPNLSTGNGRDWWAYNISHNYYEYGQTPKLGAVICFTNNNPTTNGHVGVVEEIHNDYIVTSNSDWGGRYFYLEQLKLGSDNRYHHYGYWSQGFIYNPFAGEYVPPEPPSEEAKKHKFPWAIAWQNWKGFM